MSDDALLTRIEKLEERSAFQEHTIEELSDAITDQWKLIDKLKREVGRLTDELKEVGDNMAQGAGREPPPPHY
ncbi:MAG: SlyX family protein [Alphaproteobacteria bacterium]|nr:SlyX family protein [Marinicaulis sp.]NOX94148.1 SlyX family protein [Alphaproteobacteria bacterium]